MRDYTTVLSSLRTNGSLVIKGRTVGTSIGYTLAAELVGKGLARKIPGEMVRDPTGVRWSPGIIVPMEK